MLIRKRKQSKALKRFKKIERGMKRLLKGY